MMRTLQQVIDSLLDSERAEVDARAIDLVLEHQIAVATGVMKRYRNAMRELGKV